MIYHTPDIDSAGQSRDEAFQKSCRSVSTFQIDLQSLAWMILIDNLKLKHPSANYTSMFVHLMGEALVEYLHSGYHCS